MEKVFNGDQMYPKGVSAFYEKEKSSMKGIGGQCDQIARLIFQYWAIYNIENLPNTIGKLPKYVKNFAKYLTDPLKFAKVA